MEQGVLASELPDKSVAYLLRRRPLYEQAIESIAKFISTNDLAVGDSLPTEYEFAAMFRVGRNTIREAMKTLQAIGIIETVQKRGTVLRGFHLDAVKPFMPFANIEPENNIQDRVAARIWYELSVVPFVLENADDEMLSALTAIVEESVGLANRDLERFRDCDRRFHIRMIEKLASPVVKGIGDIINEYFFMTPMPHWEYMQREQGRIIQDHRDIIDHIQKKDEDGLRTILKRHLSYKIPVED
ncbi:transcriptional regulator [Clostridia bacterium]|nr:transcriptional regulator [Clostridia bacterium]